jgi:multicomponent Na+:H+ antiporter subunit G
MKMLGEILVLIGALFSLFGALGILRMPDMYNRLQAGTKATTLGAMSLILGVGLMDTAFFGKSLLLVLFIVLTNPISSSTMARMGRRAGISLGKNPVIDEYSEVLRPRDESRKELEEVVE